VADLYGDDQRHRFLLGRLIQSDVLLYTIVFDNEVFGLKAIRDLSCFRPDEGRNQNDVRFRAHRRQRLLSKGVQGQDNEDRLQEKQASESQVETVHYLP
jgi:hypothetical protein